ncbi:MAG: hypothetical protein WEB37_00185 [Bacteroidota bacterium]
MDKKKLIETMEGHLRTFDQEIQKLTARAEKAGTEMKADLKAQLKNLRVQRDQTHKDLAALKEKGEGAWEKLRGGMEAAWRDLKHGLDKTVDRFK